MVYSFIVIICILLEIVFLYPAVDKRISDIDLETDINLDISIPSDAFNSTNGVVTVDINDTSVDIPSWLSVNRVSTGLKDQYYFDEGSYVKQFAVVGNYTFVAAGYTGLLVYDTTDILFPKIVNQYYDKEVSYGSSYAIHVFEGGEYAITCSYVSMTLIKIDDPFNITFIKKIPGTATCSRFYQYEDTLFSYASSVIWKIDYSDILNPVIAAYVDGFSYVEGMVVQKDVAYLSTGTGLLVMNISNFLQDSCSGKVVPPTIGDYTIGGGGFTTRAVVVVDHYLYFATAKGGQSVWIMDISNPKNLTFVASLPFTTESRVRGLVYGGGLLWVCAEYYVGGSRGLSVFNITQNATHPELLGYAGYSFSRPHHVELITREETETSKSGIYVADGQDGMIVFDVSDPTQPSLS